MNPFYTRKKQKKEKNQHGTVVNKSDNKNINEKLKEGNNSIAVGRIVFIEKKWCSADAGSGAIKKTIAANYETEREKKNETEKKYRCIDTVFKFPSAHANGNLTACCSTHIINFHGCHISTFARWMNDMQNATYDDYVNQA